MRKTAAILSFLFAITLFISAATMAVNDTNNTADNIRQGFDNLSAHNYAAIDAASRESESRATTERILSGLGFIAVIAGFALWPYTSKTPIQLPSQNY